MGVSIVLVQIEMPSFSKTSLDRLSTCDSRLQKLFKEVVKERDCSILCGYRPQNEQEEAVRTGKSKVHWPNSKHNKSPSLAVDVMPYHCEEPHIRWEDMEGLVDFSWYIKSKAKELGIGITWGGDFKTFFDGPHWELNDKI